jgi:hypothetical protein
MRADDYKRFLGFLRKYHCHVPFQQFRSAALSRPADSAEPLNPVNPLNEDEESKKASDPALH